MRGGYSSLQGEMRVKLLYMPQGAIAATLGVLRARRRDGFTNCVFFGNTKTVKAAQQSESLTGFLSLPVFFGLSKPFCALVESCGACDGVHQSWMPIPDPRCDRTERFPCRRYTTSLTGLSAVLELTVLYPNKTPGL
jgi:hypothetical protein